MRTFPCKIKPAALNVSQPVYIKGLLPTLIAAGKKNQQHRVLYTSTALIRSWEPAGVARMPEWGTLGAFPGPRLPRDFS